MKKKNASHEIPGLTQETQHPFVVLMNHGTMSVEYFSPKLVDTQKPHKQDELYIVAPGHGTFDREGKKPPFQKGNVLFVPAGTKHHFENCSNDFATWVSFMERKVEKCPSPGGFLTGPLTPSFLPSPALQ